MQLIAENTAKYAGGGYLKDRYIDLIYPKPVETKTPEEVIDHIKGKLTSL